jgi:hypothetical protein
MTNNMPLYVVENPVGRKQPMIHSAIPEYLLAFYSHWLFLVHRVFRFRGKDVTRLQLTVLLNVLPKPWN